MGKDVVRIYEMAVAADDLTMIPSDSKIQLAMIGDLASMVEGRSSRR